MYFNLQDQVALVTGASSGLGRHFSKILAAHGCTVGIAARRVDRLESLALEIEKDEGKAVVLPMDVTQRESVEQGLAELSKAAAPPSILVNNAGMAIPASFIDSNDDDTNAVIGLNQQAVWQVSQCVSRKLVKLGQAGTVINIASIAGLAAVSGIASYAVSKAAVVHMTKVMALELARYDIRVNAIAPGYCETEINEEFLKSAAGEELIKRIPMRRTGKLSDLDGVLLLLASAHSAYITGSVIPVDGGHLVAGL